MNRPLPKPSFTYVFAGPADVPALTTLVERVFMQFEAPDYPPEGIAKFLKYIDQAAWIERMEGGAFTLMCAEAGSRVGVIEIRQNNHLAQLFVDGKYHRQGIATHLFQLALQHCLKSDPAVEKISVNASPYALGFYKKLGFIPTDGLQQVHGILFYPMLFQIPQQPLFVG